MKIGLVILAFVIVALFGGYFLFGSDTDSPPSLATTDSVKGSQNKKRASRPALDRAEKREAQATAQPEQAEPKVKPAPEVKEVAPSKAEDLPKLDMQAIIQGFQAKSNRKALSTLPPDLLEEFNAPLKPHRRSGRLSGTPPFIDYVSLEKHGVNKNPNYRGHDFPDGYGVELRFEVMVSRDLPFPNNHHIYIEPLGGDHVYEGFLVRQSNSLTDSQVEEREKVSTYYEGMRLEGRVIIPWESAYLNMLVYDDRNSPRVFGMAAMVNRPVRLYLDSPPEGDQETRYLRALNAKRQPMVSGYVLKGDQIVGEVGENGLAAVAWETTQRAYSENDYSYSLLVDGYLETSINSEELAKAKGIPVDVIVPAKAFSGFIKGSDSLLASNSVSWTWGLFFSAANTKKKLAVPCFSVRNIPPHQFWGMVAGPSIDCAVVAANEGLTREDVRMCGQNVLKRIGDRVDLGPDSAGRFRIRLPRIAGHYLFALQDRATKGRREYWEATYAVLVVTEAMLKQADQDSTPIDLKLEVVDIEKDYLTIQGTGPAAGNGWLRYYYGDLGHVAMPPFCPENPTPEAWPAK